jgi:hypothetical protein
MGRRRLISVISPAVACLAVAMLASAGAAAAATVHVRAVLTGHAQPKLRLRIIRNGKTAYDQPVRSRTCGGYCITTRVPPAKRPLFVGNLQSGGEPAVVVGLFTGGAHCCFLDQVFTYDAARHTYVKTEHDFLDAGAVIQRLNGQVVFKSADARIAENSFTDWAASGSPLQIWRFSGRSFIDVTRRYPALIRADAANWWKAFNQNISNGVGLIAPWAADEYLLGNAAQANSTLDLLAREHKLHSALGLPHNSETAFVSELKKLLRRLGYAT